MILIIIRNLSERRSILFTGFDLEMAENRRGFAGNKTSKGANGRERRIGNTHERSAGTEFKGFAVC